MALFQEPIIMPFPLKLATVLLLFSGAVAAQTPARQDPLALSNTVEAFLKIQTAGLPGTVAVKVAPVDSRLTLAACAAPQAFFAPGSRAWGRTTVGVRCTAPTPWTLYMQATVTVTADYIASAVPLAQGQAIEKSQLVVMQGDLTALPAGIATDMAQIIGRSVNVSLPSGTPMRLDTLRSKPVVLQGQLVRMVSSGNGFSVSAEARAIGNASDGQVVQVRTPAGQQISGVARAGGLVEVAF
jgi:flagella basal body P-ring formation protein FlgA